MYVNVRHVFVCLLFLLILPTKMLVVWLHTVDVACRGGFGTTDALGPIGAASFFSGDDNTAPLSDTERLNSRGCYEGVGVFQVC